MKIDKWTVVCMVAGLLLGNLVAEWAKDYFHLFGH